MNATGSRLTTMLPSGLELPAQDVPRCAGWNLIRYAGASGDFNVIPCVTSASPHRSACPTSSRTACSRWRPAARDGSPTGRPLPHPPPPPPPRQRVPHKHPAAVSPGPDPTKIDRLGASPPQAPPPPPPPNPPQHHAPPPPPPPPPAPPPPCPPHPTPPPKNPTTRAPPSEVTGTVRRTAGGQAGARRPQGGATPAVTVLGPSAGSRPSSACVTLIPGAPCRSSRRLRPRRAGPPTGRLPSLTPEIVDGRGRTADAAGRAAAGDRRWPATSGEPTRASNGTVLQGGEPAGSPLAPGPASMDPPRSRAGVDRDPHWWPGRRTEGYAALEALSGIPPPGGRRRRLSRTSAPTAKRLRRCSLGSRPGPDHPRRRPASRPTSAGSPTGTACSSCRTDTWCCPSRWRSSTHAPVRRSAMPPSRAPRHRGRRRRAGSRRTCRRP
jgi:hypothetical protein